MSKTKTTLPKLGRGIESLVGRSFIGGGRSVIELPIDSIRPNQYQPRKVFDEKSLDVLVQSIQENGLAQPIVVRPLETKSNFSFFMLVSPLLFPFSLAISKPDQAPLNQSAESGL